MKHNEGFLNLVNEAKTKIVETQVDIVKGRMDDGEEFILIDVREESEWSAGRIPGAVHLAKGVIERDIEKHFPERHVELILYCGGGYRSALAAENLQRMGYTRVISMDGGFREWNEMGFPVDE